EYSAVHDSRARPEHRHLERLGLDGTAVYRRDDPVILQFWPPWDYNCRCAVVPLTVADAAARGVKEAQEWLRTGQPPAAPAFVAPPPFSPPAGFAGPVRLSQGDPWVRYQGPRGGRGWRNARTGEVVYGDRPGGKDASPEGGRRRPTDAPAS